MKRRLSAVELWITNGGCNVLQLHFFYASPVNYIQGFVYNEQYQGGGYGVRRSFPNSRQKSETLIIECVNYTIRIVQDLMGILQINRPAHYQTWPNGYSDLAVDAPE